MNNSTIGQATSRSVGQNVQHAPSAATRRADRAALTGSNRTSLSAATEAVAPSPVTTNTQALSEPSSDQGRSALGDVGVLAKHTAYMGAGFIPFAGATAAHTAYQAYNVISNAMAAHSAADYSLIGDIASAAGRSTMVGAALLGVGALVSYPLGRYVMAPAAEKGLDALPTEPKEAAISLAQKGWDTTKTIVQEGSTLASKTASAAVDFAKTAHETVPAAMVKTGFFLGSATDGGSEAVVQAANNGSQDTRVAAAHQKHTANRS